MTLAEILRKEGLEEGLEKGIEKGIEQGIKQEAINVARRLILIKMPIHQIIEVTKLSKKEVEKLMEEILN